MENSFQISARMAETVKKSRIVSEPDDNLEEALMEEFNLRLKNCMSQDDLQNPDDARIVSRTTEDFIRAEQEHYYEEPVETNGIQKQNGYHRDEDSIYENVGHQTNKTDEKTDQYIDMTLTCPQKEDEPSSVYEDIEEDRTNGPDLTLTDLCESREADSEVKSAKDRMLLSTDVGSCLLFTQTVTSPMLTPSEENIDFLKGFRRESNGESEPVTDIDEVKPKESEWVIVDKEENSEENENGSENVYENSEFLKQHKDGIIYENLKDVQETIYENLKDLGETKEKEGDEVIYQNVGELREEDEVQEEVSEGLETKEDEVDKVEECENVDESDKVADEVYEETKGVDILKQINKFESEESTQVTESYVETTTIESHSSDNKGLKKKKSKKSRKEEKENISVKSSFNKFDALQKKNVLHIRSSDSSKAQEKFNGAQVDTSNCRSCGKAVFQMEQIKAEKAVWHKNCFRCTECSKQLNVDTYQSNEGTLYCKPHFKALFAPKAVEDDTPRKPRKPELIIRESQPVELPPDVVRASDKPDLGLEELHSLNVKERFQVFEQHSTDMGEDRTPSAVNVKRSPSILSKLAKFQAKGMDIGVADDSLNGIPIEETSSEEEEEEDGLEGEDADLIRAKRVQKEKPFHFTGMSDVKSRWEQGEQLSTRDERREERKQEIQSIRNRLFMGKQGKMKEAYQQAVMESESCVNLRKEPIEVCDTKSLKERFEKGELVQEKNAREKDGEETEVFESEISKKSRSLFLELDANASKPPQLTPISTPKIDVKKARDSYIQKQATEDTVKSSKTNVVDDVQIRTSDIQQRFKFFETYKEPEKEKRAFRITPPREGQVKAPTPDRDVYRDPEIVRAEELVEDSVIAKETHTATKMLNKFRQMEENLSREPQPTGPKPLKRFTPPPEPTRPESSSEGESGSEEESEEEDEPDQGQIADADLLEAQKAARAKQLRAKFERWEANEIKREQNSSAVNIIEEIGEEQSQIESTKSLRARFESMRENSSETNRQPRVKVNRFVELPNVTETCESCNARVYPLEKISVHNHIYHKNCFKCMECNCVLRMDSYSYNQGLLYCMPHFKRLFISKGNYDTGFGLGQHKEKWNATMA
ncbi:F-actin-monooxygenase Mical isoform X9 [Zophobas morio]|uniref:F-actin-monooxygenase Mical isoform X9 n=1 Tax=Zophobas morio TaxID=2755281 RepID=UPI0030835D41